MAAIPAGGSLVATTDYYRRRIGSTSSSSSCGSSEYSGEVIPHHPDAGPTLTRDQPSVDGNILSGDVAPLLPGNMEKFSRSRTCSC